MGGVVSKVTDAVGLTSKVPGGGGASSAAADKLAKDNLKFQKQQFEFQKEQYTDWKAVYGDIQTNLGDYYKNLTPDTVTAMGLQNQQMEFQKARTAVQQDFAQRGLSNSGAEVATTSLGTFQNAEARARIRTEAPEKVAQDKLTFLGVGLGQGTAMLGNINSAASNVNSAYATGINGLYGMATNLNNNRTTVQGNNQNAMGQVIGAGIGFLGGG